MELESLKRQLNYLDDNNIEATKLVTDRHTQVSAYMAHQKPEIEHSDDVWHVAKGITIQLCSVRIFPKFCRFDSAPGWRCVIILVQSNNTKNNMQMTYNRSPKLHFFFSLYA